MCSELSKIFRKEKLKDATDCLDHEINRLFTFTQWKTSTVDANLLARIGFYSLGVGDVVRCQFCRLELGYWEEGEDAVFEHVKWSPWCPLLNGLQTRNVPLDADQLSRSLSRVFYGYQSKRVILPNSFIKTDLQENVSQSFCPSCNNYLTIKLIVNNL